jgi:general stress protein 26
MTIDRSNRHEVENRLWDEIEEAHVGMLGVMGAGPRHFQPMTPFCEREGARIWFFANRSAEIASSLGDGREAMFVIQRDGRFQACVGGQLMEDRDLARIDKFWNGATAAYFPRGKADPDMTLLCFDCVDAELWISEGGALKFAWEVAKANLTRHRPEMGGKTSLNLS